MEAFLIAATPPTLTALLAALAVWVRQRGRHHQTRQTLDEARTGSRSSARGWTFTASSRRRPVMTMPADAPCRTSRRPTT